MNQLSQDLRWAPALLAAALLAACGGGDEAPSGPAAAPDAAAAGAPPSVASLSAGDITVTSSSTTATATPTASTTTPATGTAPTSGSSGGFSSGGYSAAPTPRTLLLRAKATLQGGVGAMVDIRVDGVVVARTEVRSTDWADFSFPAAQVKQGSKVDVVYTNDAKVGSEDRNLYVAYLAGGPTMILPYMPGTVIDKGSGARAFDGLDTIPGQSAITSNGALRLTWPAEPAGDSTLARKVEAARFLLQASFGPTSAEVDRLAQMLARDLPISSTGGAGTLTGTAGFSKWIDEQLAIPYRADFVDYVQSKYALGDDWRPNGKNYTPNWVGQRFWATAATAPDQLRKRVAFALHQIFVISQQDSNLYSHSRAYANYLDLLNRHAFGNYRDLIQDISLSPAMGIYLSHIRNRKEDPATGRLPDENYAREVQQLLSIGLYELNRDGTLKLDAQGQAIETYNNADVMALAKVFTGWSWGFPDNELTANRFRNGNPDYRAANDRLIDLQPMKSYPGQFSTAEVRLWEGKPWGVTIPGNVGHHERLRIALDALHRHPNVGPFIGRQLIQRLVTSEPSTAYVGRVAAAFDNNGRGVRGDMAAVVRAVLLDPEARFAAAQPALFGKLREPVLRVAQWARAMGATSASGEFQMASELEPLSQRALYPSSVFSYFRPGYIPPGTVFAQNGATAPEFQIVNESTTVQWVNRVEAMAGSGIGSGNNGPDVSATLAPQIVMTTAGDLGALLRNLDLLLFTGRMSPALRADIADAVAGVSGSDAASHRNRARIAVYVAMSAPEYLVQR